MCIMYHDKHIYDVTHVKITVLNLKNDTKIMRAGSGRNGASRLEKRRAKHEGSERRE
jgi:hypothetical protein